LSSCKAYCKAHLHKKFLKNQYFIAFTAACPEMQKAVFGSLGTLGVKRSKKRIMKLDWLTLMGTNDVVHIGK
jgi:hypothetical protein